GEVGGAARVHVGRRAGHAEVRRGRGGDVERGVPGGAAVGGGDGDAGGRSVEGHPAAVDVDAVVARLELIAAGEYGRAAGGGVGGGDHRGAGVGGDRVVVSVLGRDGEVKGGAGGLRRGCVHGEMIEGAHGAAAGERERLARRAAIQVVVAQAERFGQRAGGGGTEIDGEGAGCARIDAGRAAGTAVRIIRRIGDRVERESRVADIGNSDCLRTVTAGGMRHRGGEAERWSVGTIEADGVAGPAGGGVG